MPRYTFTSTSGSGFTLPPGARVVEPPDRSLTEPGIVYTGDVIEADGPLDGPLFVLLSSIKPAPTKE